jgi:ribosomal protein S18 acetylase RimI-like enzyme
MPQIMPIAKEHIAGFREAIGSVARERAFLARTETPSLEWATEFVTGNIRRDLAQFVAVEADMVVGWCDIRPGRLPGFEHSGTVGMGVLKEWRGRGLGRALLEACIRKAFDRGLTRVDLEVFTSNGAAIALYRRLGFVQEGIKRRARFLDGRYDDLLVMALLREPGCQD